MKEYIGNKSTENYDTFRNYKIVKYDDKYGVENLRGEPIIDSVFDYIRWHKEENLVEFCLDCKHAICRVDDIQNL